MARKPKTKKKTGSLSVNFKGVDGKRSLLPEDDYLVEVEEATQGESSSGNDMVTFVFAVSDGKHKGAKLWMYCPLEEKSLWKLRGVLEALGEEVPDDDMDIELDDLIGKELMAVVTHESYDGAKRAKMSDFYAVGDGEEAEDDEAEDEKPKKKEKKADKVDKKKASKKDADEDDDGDDEADEETEEDAEASKAAARKARRLARKGGKAEKEEKPSKKSAKPEKKKKKKLYSSDDVEGSDEDELEELVEEAGLEIDLADFKTLKKKQAAVIDALEDADLLEASDDDGDDD